MRAGVPLAFAFLATLGRTGLVTTLLVKYFGFNLYATGFNLLSFSGLTLTYLYFQIPLMVLIITPALEGLRREWREAAESLGASGGMETVATIKTILTGTIHPTINQETPDPACDLDYVPNTARKAEVRAALRNQESAARQVAAAARFVIAEVEDVTATGSLDPDRVHTPGNYVDRVVKTVSVKRIEQRTTRKREMAAVT